MRSRHTALHRMGFGKKKEAGSAQEQGSSNDEEGIAVSHEIGLGLHRVVQRGGQRGLALETQFDVYRLSMCTVYYGNRFLRTSPTDSTLVARE